MTDEVCGCTVGWSAGSAICHLAENRHSGANYRLVVGGACTRFLTFQLPSSSLLFEQVANASLCITPTKYFCNCFHRQTTITVFDWWKTINLLHSCFVSQVSNCSVSRLALVSCLRLSAKVFEILLATADRGHNVFCPQNFLRNFTREILPYSPWQFHVAFPLSSSLWRAFALSYNHFL